MKKSQFRLCVECGESFQPANPRYYICPDCWRAQYQQGERCAAIRNDLTSCNAWAMRDHVFCHAHMKQGYGLFELAVRRYAEQAETTRARGEAK